MYDERECAVCNTRFTSTVSGRMLYCSDPCRRIKRAAAEKDRRELIKLANNQEWKSSLLLPVDRIAKEAPWHYACGVCGMKSPTREKATACCRYASIVPTEPHQCTTEAYIVWAGELHFPDQMGLTTLESATGKRLLSLVHAAGLLKFTQTLSNC